MEEKTNYTVVGFIVIILTAGLLLTGIWLSIGFGQKKYRTYAVYMHEAVSGLSEEAPVKFNGVLVGFVSQIQLNHDDPQQVRLLLSIEAETPITTSTTATLISQGITGTTIVGLSASSPDLSPLRTLPNQPYPIIPSKPSLLKQLDQVLEEVSKNVNTVSLRLKQILSPQNAFNIKKSLMNLKEVTTVFAQNTNTINQGLKNINRFFDHANTSITRLNNMTDAGKITINKISQQTVPAATTLLHQLNAITANLEKVSSEMRQNPSVIIRGTSSPKPGPGE